MSPEVVRKKLAAASIYLSDLKIHEHASHGDFMKRHYEVERLLELLLMTASDIVFHLLTAKGEPAPSSYRAAFLRAGEIGLISRELSTNLALGAGLRNILVHEYAEIDYDLLHKSIPSALRDMTAFIKELS
jgi:uncharacterized protein YutE (UPF0331/DUF86 family)